MKKITKSVKSEVPQKVEVEQIAKVEIEVETLVIDGAKVIGIVEETPTGIHYKLDNGTTTWVSK